MSADAEDSLRQAFVECLARERKREAWRESWLVRNIAVQRAETRQHVETPSLKRSTMLMRRMRQGNLCDTADWILGEIQCVGLHKYIDELVPAIMDMLCKCTLFKERMAAIEILGELYGLYGDDLRVPLTVQVQNYIVPVVPDAAKQKSSEQCKKGDEARIVMQRSLIRVVAEMAFTGLIGVTDAADCQESLTQSTAWLYQQLAAFMYNDPAFVYLPIIMYALRSYASILVKYAPLHDAGESVECWEEDTLVPGAQKVRFRLLFESYFARLVAHLQSLQQTLQACAQRIRNAIPRYGAVTVFEERENALQCDLHEYDALCEELRTFAQMIQVRCPTLKQISLEADTAGEHAQMLARIDADIEAGKSAWDNETERAFYTELLSVRVAECDDGVDLLFKKLLSVQNVMMLDHLARQFALHNTDNVRAKLCKHIMDVPCDRQNLYPFYARLTATLQCCMPSVLVQVLEALARDFRHLLSNGQGEHKVSARRKLMLFYAELTQFHLVPIATIFQLLSNLLDQFKSHSIEMLAMFLGRCGRFLLLNRALSARMLGYLEQMQRKRNALHLDMHDDAMLQNAYYDCLPQEKTQEKQVPLSEEMQLLHFLFAHKMRPANVSAVVEVLRRVDFAREEHHKYLLQRFTRPWEYNTEVYAVLAQVLRFLAGNKAFANKVVDNVIEQIQQCVETNAYAENQRKYALVRYFGQLYRSSIVADSTMLDMLWYLCVETQGDGPLEYMRIRLVNALLVVLRPVTIPHKAFDDVMLVYFAYLGQKKQPIPAEVAQDLALSVGTIFKGMGRDEHMYKNAALRARTMLNTHHSETLRGRAERYFATRDSRAKDPPKELQNQAVMHMTPHAQRDAPSQQTDTLARATKPVALLSRNGRSIQVHVPSHAYISRT
ncbi:mRNA decay protein [Malassezia vespertilionis]|uniref:MIF4G domain-containing protein n=1 Tax=Malassezia vespertilionis TaxID=2020962 RepID=A0A2N1JCP1_9BASI|nr:mRNA decay protein [Malassezia vespertilionis]PKI84303.1 hypothetical protein MVES_001451 [Malassezia vespertilionis]WFD06198.1 mRNA decay protein [Malassezia vespertilionis]